MNIGNLRRAPGALAAAGRVAVVILSVALSALWLSPSASAAGARGDRLHEAAEQVLTWTADDSMTAYKSAPSTATAGPATIVFDNSTASGNTTGMTHTLTFDVSTPGYNHDVDINIISSPFDVDGGHHEVQANLTPGKYRYYCAMPGHTMSGELVVTDGGGTDTTPPEVSASVSGDKDDDGNYVGSATVTVSASDTESGVATVEYALDDAPYTAYSAPVSVNDAGEHTVKYRATDKAGNTSPEGSVSFTVAAPSGGDTTPPEVSVQTTGVQDWAWNYVGSATVTISASDDDSGVATVEYALDGQPFTAYTKPFAVGQPGAHTVRFRATDKAGNTSDVGTAKFRVVERGSQ
jgi:hypothetical protein